jgi:acid phosphatase (class A)
MRPVLLASVCLLASAVAGVGLSETGGPAGYLNAQSAPDTLKILPPSPKAGDPTDTADRAIFQGTRGLNKSPRWTLAQNDAHDGVAELLADFSCAVGAPLDPARAPRLAALLARVHVDVHRAVDAPKNFYKRPRPYAGADGPVCVDKAALAANPDYPSGHASWGWAAGLILAELAPDRATPILVRARAFGESRVVCGVHNASAVIEGRTNGSVVVAALHGDESFRRDIEAARAELAALRTGASAPAPLCVAEAALTAQTPW